MAAEGKVFGDYRVLGEVARGGQAVVLRAAHLHSGEPCALKLLVDRSPGKALRFRQEAKVLARVSHPNLIRVLGMGEHNGMPYISLELVEGDDLESLGGRGRAEPEWAAHVLVAVAHALHHCHGRGLVHRDVKPANIIVERETERPVLIDFGLVKRDPQQLELSSLDGAVALSKTGELMGTPGFMAPEQVAPSRFGQVGPPADVYGLGAALFVLLTGRVPFQGSNLAALLAQVVGEEAPRVREVSPEVSPALDDLCRRALSKRPEDRPQSAKAFALELAQAARLEAWLPTFGDTVAEDAARERLTGQPLAPSDPRRLGPYQIQAVMGRGGMGSVFKATHAQLGVVRAVKILTSSRQRERVVRFGREVRHLWRVRHPGVVGVHEWGQEGELLWYAMDLIGGEPLNEVISRGRLEPDRATEIALGVGRGVSALHAAGVVHRDLKPGNVVLRADGSPVVIDLGLAVAPEVDERMTKTGALVGTPSYMSPEQIHGKPPDPRSDVWALGLILFEMLTGRRAIDADSVAGVLAQALGSPVPAPSEEVPELPAAFDTVCARALAREPADRFPHASAFVDALQEAQRRGGPSGAEVRRRRLALGGALVVSLGVLGFTASLVLSEEVRPPAPVGLSGSSAGDRSPAEAAATLTRAQLAAGERDLRRLQREKGEQREAAARKWLEDHAGHPAFEEVSQLLREAESSYPRRIWRDVYRARLVDDERMLAITPERISKVHLRSLEGETLRIYRPGFSVRDMQRGPDGRWLVGGDSVAMAWIDLERDELERWQVELPIRCIEFSPDGERVAVAGDLLSYDYQIRILDVASKTPLVQLSVKASVRDMVFTPDGERLVVGHGTTILGSKEFNSGTGDPNNGVSVYDSKTGERLEGWYLTAAAHRLVLLDEARCLAGTNGGELRLYDVRDLKYLRDFKAREASLIHGDGPSMVLTALGAAPRRLLLRGDRLLCALGESDINRGGFSLWDVTQERRIRHRQDMPAVMDLEVTPNGEWMLVSLRSQVQLWKAWELGPLSDR